MKRIISVLTAFVIVFSGMGVFALSAENNGNSVNYDNKTQLLRLVEIIDEEFQLSDEPVSRGEFAGYLVKAKGMDGYASSHITTSFSDVNAETKNADEIALAKELKLINGYSDGTYKPDNNITVFEAAICFIRALGYDTYADVTGGFPAGYYEVIRQTKLLDGVKGAYSDNLTGTDAVTIIWNALHTKVLKQSSFGGEINFETANGVTLLYESFKLTVVEGIVNGVDISNLYGENDLTPYRVYIGEEIYYAPEFLMNEFLGYYVRAYICYEDSNDTIKLAFPLEGKNDEKILDISNITNIGDGKIIVENSDGSIKDYKYDKNAAIIFNGTNTTKRFDLNLLKDKDGVLLSGTVKLLDNNRNNNADVVFIDAYEEMVVGKVNSYTSVVYDCYDYENSVLLSLDTNEPYVLIYDENGDYASFTDIREGTSIIIYSSADDAHQTLVRVYTSSVKLTGKIEQIWDDEGGKYLIIDGKEYKISHYAEKNSGSLIVGRTIDFTLNAKGIISKIEYNTTPGDYTMATVTAVWKGAGFEAGYSMRFMNSEGSMYDVKIADEITIDNRKLNLSTAKNAEEFMKILKKASAEIGFEREAPYYYQMIKYGVDKTGSINYIDTILGENGEKTARNTCSTNNEFYSEAIIDAFSTPSVSMLGDKVILTSDTTVYMVPEEGSEKDPDQYSIHNKTYFNDNDKRYTVHYFKDDIYGFEATHMICEYEKNFYVQDFTASYITKVTEVVNKDNLICKKLYCYQRGVMKEILADKEIVSSAVADISVDDLKPGDIIYPVIGADGQLAQFIIMYKEETQTTYNQALVDCKLDNKIVFGHVVSSTAYGIKLIYDFALNGNDLLTDEIAYGSNYTVFNNNQFTITVIDSHTKTPKTGSYMDVVGYDETTTGYSKVLCHSRESTMSMGDRQYIREIFVYK